MKKKYKNLAGFCQANTKNCPRKADMDKLIRRCEDLEDTISGLATLQDKTGNAISWVKLKKKLQAGK